MFIAMGSGVVAMVRALAILSHSCLAAFRIFAYMFVRRRRV